MLVRDVASKAYFHLAKPAAVIRVSGEDAFEFLQAQFSNDLRGDGPRAVYGLWLDHRGRIHADSFVVGEGEEDWRIVSHHSPARVIIEKLERFVVADDVEFSDVTDSFAALRFWGDDAMEALLDAAELRLPTGASVLRLRECDLWRGRNPGQVTVDVLGSPEAVQTVATILKEQGAEAVDAAEFQRSRFAAALPAIPDEVGPADTPADADLDEAAVSFTKGCFLGQEVVARMHHKGRSTRCLRGIHLGVQPVNLPADLVDEDGSPAGQIRAIAPEDDQWIGLALLKRKAVEPPRALRLADSEESVEIIFDE